MGKGTGKREVEVKVERGIEEEKIKEGIREIRCKGKGEGRGRKK